MSGTFVGCGVVLGNTLGDTVGAAVDPAFPCVVFLSLLLVAFLPDGAFFTFTLQTYFFLPIFACTLAVPGFLPLMVTPVFFFLLSVTFFLPEITVHFTFFLLFFSLSLTVFPIFTVTVFLLNFTFFFLAA